MNHIPIYAKGALLFALLLIASTATSLALPADFDSVFPRQLGDWQRTSAFEIGPPQRDFLFGMGAGEYRASHVTSAYQIEYQNKAADALAKIVAFEYDDPLYPPQAINDLSPIAPPTVEFLAKNRYLLRMSAGKGGAVVLGQEGYARNADLTSEFASQYKRAVSMPGFEGGFAISALAVVALALRGRGKR